MSRTFRRTRRDDWAEDLDLPWWAPDSVHRKAQSVSGAARTRRQSKHGSPHAKLAI